MQPFTTWTMMLVFTLASQAAETPGQSVVPSRVEPFALQDVRLLDGPFKQAMAANAAYLLRLEPDRLLARFREYAGLKPKAAAYGGWEQEGLSGHTLGHYLSACALLFAATGDVRYRERVADAVAELALCQNAHGDGFVAGFPDGRTAFQELATGNIRARPFNLNGIWSPFYTLHKLFAGLRDAHHLCGQRQALDVATRLADWMERTLAGLSDQQMQQVLACEFGGLNEVLADLHADTGEARYFALSRRFNHQAVLEPLARGEDCLPGLHANTQIPKFVGLARRHQLTGDPSDLTIAKFFWERVTRHHSYVTGGNGESEYFGPPDQLADRLTDRTTETCNTYNLLKLTRLLFQLDPRADYGDFYERALFNHILASQDPASGMVTYFVPLRGGFAKTYTTPFDTFTCCLGTGLESHAKYADSLYFHDRDTLIVNLFIASELTWKEKQLVVRQETRFPDEDSVKLTFQCETPVALTLRIRCPHWAQDGVRIRLVASGQADESPVRPHAAGIDSLDHKPGSYAELRRTWHNGDRVEIQLPLSLRLEAMPDNPQRVAIFYGPLLLAGELGPEQDPAAANFDYVPALVTDAQALLQHIQPVASQSCTFRTDGVGQPRDVTLLPFFRMHHKRYAVYWDLFTPDQWAQRKTAHAADQTRMRKLRELTVDLVQPGHADSEQAHRMQGDKLESEDFCGRLYRLSRGGWFSYELKVLPDRPMSLICTYWGGERPGSRVFEVLVDGCLLATQTLANDRPSKFFDSTYAIPEAATRGKSRVTVRFQSQPDKWAGGVFGVSMLQAP